jgi:hypothetical protein
MCLAILVLLFGGMFLFVKQKLAIMESRLNLLTETISTMAGITMNSISENEVETEAEAESDAGSDVESDAGSDAGSDADGSESEAESEVESEAESKINVEFEIPNLVNVELTRVDDVIVNPIKIIVSDDDVTSPVKQIVVDTSYESLTVKELKEKISELNGPKLKTKKEMVDYLKNKI